VTKIAHAEKCPVCHGAGKDVDAVYGLTLQEKKDNAEQCHGCGGLGWVTVRD